MKVTVIAAGILWVAPAVAADTPLSRSIAAELAGDSAKAIVEAKAAIASLSSASPADVAAPARVQLGRLLVTDDPDAAIRLLDQAIPALRGTTFQRAEAVGYRAMALCYAKGIVACRDAMATAADGVSASAPEGIERERAAFVLSTAANIAIAGGRRERSDADMRRAMTLLDIPVEHQGIFAAQSYANAADQATRINALDMSMGYTLRAIAITERLRGPNHPDLVDPLSLLGEAYLRTTRYADAGAVLTRAVAIADSVPTVPVMARVLALRSLGGFYAQTGRSDLGARLFERAVAVGEADPTTSRMMAGVYRDLASLHVQSRRFPQARAVLAKAATNAERATGKSSSAYGGVLLDIAEMEVDAGDLAAAERAAAEARTAFAGGLEAANARNGDPVAVQARIAFRRGNTVEAARLFDDALRLMKGRDLRSLALLTTKANAAEAWTRAEPKNPNGWALGREAGNGMTDRLVREAMIAGTSGQPTGDQRQFYDVLIAVAWSKSESTDPTASARRTP